MRLKSMLLASCVGAVGFGMASPAEAGGFYGSIFGGYDMPSAKGPANTVYSATNGTASSTVIIGYTVHGAYNAPEDGFVVGVALGYDLSDVITPGLKAELEGAYRHNNVHGNALALFTNSASTGTYASQSGADLSVWSVMANLWYEIDTGSKIRPYLGGGIGWGRQKWKIGLVGPGPYFHDSEDEGLAWQLGAGFNWHVSDHAAIGLGYRYFHMDDLTVTYGPAIAGPGYQFKADGVHQDITMSLSYDLN
ncbi:MAG: outer membrane beta-barrel protein [Alphaproteobacteria bacterium]|nr:outer membrane beta-barrel protein [Alphaproteobacteria bacterium]